MPTSAQSAVRASARLSVDGSDCDREPARDNVIPCNVNYYRRSPPRAHPRYRDACRVDCDQLAFDHGFGRSGAITDIDALAVEPFVVSMTAQRAFCARRGHLEVIWSIDESRVIEQRTGDATHALTVLDCDWLGVVDRDAKRPSGLTRLLQGVELIAHVVERGLEQLLYGRYRPCRHVRGLRSHYQPRRLGACSCFSWSVPFRAGKPGPSYGRNINDVSSSKDSGFRKAAPHRRLSQRLELPPDHQQGSCIEDRAVRA